MTEENYNNLTINGVRTKVREREGGSVRRNVTLRRVLITIVAVVKL
jgi:hypothetical protein